ncbi:MAG: MATE family efflux transporter [Kiritimatiellae bacterium]|nr:MATE family efflux transporter [Kiritimatiellia bacterium]
MDTKPNNLLISGSLTKGVFKLAGPMFISAILQNAQSLIDLFWVGRLGSQAVAALGISVTILMLFFPVAMGIATGTVALVSQLSGAGRDEEASNVAGQSLVLGLMMGAITGLIGWFFAEKMCLLLGGNHEIAKLGGEYLQIYFLGSFTVFVLIMGNSVLQGAGNTVIPMIALLLANVLNIILDPILIFGLLGFPKMGVRGAALAAVISGIIAAGLVVILLSRGIGGIRVRRSQWRLRYGIAMSILRIGVPSTGQLFARTLMQVVLIKVVAFFGTAAIAAYSIGLRIHQISLLPAFALGNAAATMMGQNLGAGRADRARKASWVATSIDAGIMMVLTAVFFMFAPVFIRIFDTNPEVVRIGSHYLMTVSPFYIFTAFAIVLGRALSGAGRTMATMILTIISLWGIQVPLAIVLSRYCDMGTQGVWWAISIANTIHGLLITWWFQRVRENLSATANLPVFTEADT